MYSKKDRLKLYKDAEKCWGKLAQYDQFIEEASELIVAINKFKRKNFYGEYENDNSIEDNLLEELADTYLCLELLISYAGEKKFAKRLDEKLDKFKYQIDKQKAKNINTKKIDFK